MTQNENRDRFPKHTVHVYIGEEEWKNYSYEKKLRLLYRLKQSESVLANELENSLSTLIEEEQKRREIDFEATLKNIEESE